MKKDFYLYFSVFLLFIVLQLTPIDIHFDVQSKLKNMYTV